MVVELHKMFYRKCKACEVRIEQIELMRSAYESRILDLSQERDYLRDSLFRVLHILPSNSERPQEERRGEKVVNMKSWPQVQRALEAKDLEMAAAKKEADEREKYWKEQADKAAETIKEEKINVEAS